MGDDLTIPYEMRRQDGDMIGHTLHFCTLENKTHPHTSVYISRVSLTTTARKTGLFKAFRVANHLV